MNSKKIALFLTVLIMGLCLTSGTRQTTIFVIGDSTAAEKGEPDTNPERGWGMVLQGFFDEHVLIENHAVNGRSSKSFLDEGRWQVILDRIKPGDYVFIQFGHNDEKQQLDRHTEPGSTFDAHLERYVSETREKGGIPVLFSCVVRRNFYQKVDSGIDDESLRNMSFSDELVNSDTLIDTHGAYKDVPRVVAQKMGVKFIDANRITHDLEQSMGIAGSRKLHMWFKPNEEKSIPKGRRDNTHYNVYGARIVAGLLADAVGKEIKALQRHIVHYDYVVSKKGRGNYMSLEDAIKTIPNSKSSKIYVLDGTWTLPENVSKSQHFNLVCFPGATVKRY